MALCPPTSGGQRLHLHLSIVAVHLHILLLPFIMSCKYSIEAAIENHPKKKKKPFDTTRRLVFLDKPASKICVVSVTRVSREVNSQSSSLDAKCRIIMERCVTAPPMMSRRREYYSNR